MRSEKSMPLRSSRAGAGAIEERAEEGDHAQQSFGTEAASPLRLLAGVTVADCTVRSSHERAVHIFVGWHLRSRDWRTDSVSDLHSMGKVSSQC